MIRILLPWLALLFALLVPAMLGRIHGDPNHIAHSVLPSAGPAATAAAAPRAAD